MIEAKAFHAFIRVYSLFRNERLSAVVNLALYKAFIRSVISYAYPPWEFAADSHLLKSQRLLDKVIRIAGKFPRRSPTRELHVVFGIPYVFRCHKIMQAASPKSYQVMTMKMFAKLDKAKHNTGNIRGLILFAA
jgi:hypothetical protein